MILGDLNAGCSYVTIKGWRALRLRSDPKFHWLIGDEQDTTVREKTHCAYDRSDTLDSLIMTLQLLVHSPFNVFLNFHVGSLSTDVRWFPALFQAQLNPSTLKKISISARRRWTSNTYKSLVHVRSYIWYPSCFFCGNSGSWGQWSFPGGSGPEAEPPIPSPQWAVNPPSNQEPGWIFFILCYFILFLDFMNFGCHNKSILATDFDRVFYMIAYRD